MVCLSLLPSMFPREIFALSEDGICWCMMTSFPIIPTPIHVYGHHGSLSLLREKDGIRRAREVLVRLGLEPTQEDCVATHRVCQIVSTRSASLCAATLAAVLRRIKENKGEERLRSTIGVDGSVYKKHPQ